jgi:uncharacterized membrane protein
MGADGLFHIVAWFLVVFGSALPVRAEQRRRPAPPWRVHVGTLLVALTRSPGCAQEWLLQGVSGARC